MQRPTWATVVGIIGIVMAIYTLLASGAGLWVPQMISIQQRGVQMQRDAQRQNDKQMEQDEAAQKKEDKSADEDQAKQSKDVKVPDAQQKFADEGAKKMEAFSKEADKQMKQAEAAQNKVDKSFDEDQVKQSKDFNLPAAQQKFADEGDKEMEAFPSRPMQHRSRLRSRPMKRTKASARSRSNS